MQPLPSTFLETIAKQYELSPEQTEALIKRLGDPQSEQDDAEAMHISVNALRNRMSGVYSKFSIGGKGPGKLRKLHDFLSAQYRKGDSPAQDGDKPQADIEAIVQTIRQQVQADIHHRCGTMRVLDMEQPIGIGDIYTNVNILEKLSGRRRLGLNELLQDCDLENFDRFLLGQVRHERVPGLEAVERHRQLMVLGKPGAGKTTFMKRLATLCNHGEFQAGRVPVFVTLKEFAEAKGQPDLQTYISQQWTACGISDTEALAQILGQGRALILLDGLDEVQETDHDRILQEIKDFAGQYRACQFVMTCRIAAREYTFEHFTEVEVADFDEDQIAEFATKWFTAKRDAEKGETFIRRLKDNQPIQELATNPLLLTLLCLVFGEANDFPANRAELYKEGLDVLLKKWDAKRNIERDQVYKKLSLKRKEDLLSQLAFATFTQGDYFFKQTVVEQHIIDYIRNLSGAKEDEEALQLDSEAVLKSIEAQHGLLVERARSIYSFSHLTFQEYFTAKQITRPTTKLPLTLADLAQHVNETRYHEIFLLAVGMLPEADVLLLAIKKRTDALLADDREAQIWLSWVREKSKSITISCKSAAIRAFYLALSLANLYNLAVVTSYDINKNRSGFVAFSPNLKTVHLLNLYCKLDKFINLNLEKYHSLDFDLCLYRNLNLELHYICTLETDIYYEQIDSLHPSQVSTLSPIVGTSSLSDFMLEIKSLKAKFPDRKDHKTFYQWLSKQGQDWAAQLRIAMTKYRNIGHDWQFTKAQKEKLRQYYYANHLLVDCLNSDCYVTKTTRQYIEDTLLLPISEIEKIPVPGR